MGKIATMYFMATLATTLSFGTSAFAHSVSNAKASELSLHRIERLVVLKKIEESYQSKFSALKLDLIAHEKEEDPSFKATAFLPQGQDGTQKVLEIVMNEEGKALSFNVLSGADPVSSPAWTGKDAVTLCENALHYVLEGAVTKPELVPYNEKMTGFTLTQGTNAAGETVAVVDMNAKDEAKTLRVRMKLDGTFDSAEFLTQAGE